MRRTIDAESLSAALDWRQFEELAEAAFSSLGFETRRNFRLKKPVIEIDLLASKNGLGFSVDCKHWKRTVGHAAMFAISERQIARSKRVLESEPLGMVIPLILTWHDEHLHILENGVAVVPIHKLSDFVLNWETCSDRLLALTNQGSGVSKG